VWPKLLGLDTKAAAEPPTQKELEAHAEYHQVVLDVNRSLKRFPPGKWVLNCICTSFLLCLLKHAHVFKVLTFFLLYGTELQQ
jgi:hypothetical protein